MGQLIEVIPKTEYRFDGRTGTTQEIILRERIPTVAFASGVLLVRVHSTANMSGTAAAKIEVLRQSESRFDPGTFFIQARGGGVEIASVTIDSSTSTPILLSDDFSVPIAAMVRVMLEWSQGGTPAGADQIIVIGVDLVGRAGA